MFELGYIFIKLEVIATDKSTTQSKFVQVIELEANDVFKN